MVHLSGRIKSGIFTDGTVILTLPAYYRPKETVYFRTSAPFFQVDTAGTLKIYGATSNTDVGFDNFHFRAY